MCRSSSFCQSSFNCVSPRRYQVTCAPYNHTKESYYKGILTSIMCIFFMLPFHIKGIIQLCNSYGFPFLWLCLPPTALEFFRLSKVSTFMNVRGICLRQIVDSRKSKCNLISMVQIQSKFHGTVNHHCLAFIFIFAKFSARFSAL